MQLEVWLFASIVTLFVETTIGVLNDHGVLAGSKEELSIGRVLALVVGLWFLGSVIGNSPLPMKNQLRELRALNKWSQGALAEKLGVSRQTINAIETEKYDPSLPLAFKIGRLFGQSLESIFDPDA